MRWSRPGRRVLLVIAGTGVPALLSPFPRTDGATTLQTWTVTETLLGTIGFVLALLLSLVL